MTALIRDDPAILWKQAWNKIYDAAELRDAAQCVAPTRQPLQPEAIGAVMEGNEA